MKLIILIIITTYLLLICGCKHDKNEYHSYKITSPIIIDGILDSIWGWQDVEQLTNIIYKKEYWKGVSDLSADFRIAYDSTALYFDVEIADDILFTQIKPKLTEDKYFWSKEDYDYVHIEFKKNEQLNDLFLNYNADTLYSNLLNQESIKYVQKTTCNGYCIEIKIPFKCFRFWEKEIKDFEFDISIGDNDKNYIVDDQTLGGGESILSWSRNTFVNGKPQPWNGGKVLLEDVK